MQMMTARQQAAQMLGVTEDATEAAIKRAYRFAVRQAHPDVQGGDVALFEQLTHATDLLLDRPQARWAQAPGEAPELVSAEPAGGQAAPAAGPTMFTETDEVQRGPVVWLRSVIRLRTLAFTAAWCVTAVVLASLGWSLLAVASVVPAAVLMLGMALYGALGRPEWRAVQAQLLGMSRRLRRVGTRSGRAGPDGDEAPTGPIPVMTQERMRQYEQTGQ